MKSFAFSELNRQSGEVLDAAMAAPVMLTKRGKPKLVVMPVELYEILARGRAFAVEDAPDLLDGVLQSSLDDVLARS